MDHNLDLIKGMMIMVSIPDKILSDNTINFLKENHIGGVILFSYNIDNEEQLKSLISDLKSKVNPNLLISLDQEGGDVVRVKWDPTSKISAYQIGQTGNLQYAYDIAYQRAIFLKQLGFNMILGPVCDIYQDENSYIKIRSFSNDPNKVSQFVEMTVRAQRDAGIISVLKHFPGHGKTSINSHLNIPIINLNDQELQKELKPFKAGIDAGAEAIMMGHIVNQNLDDQLPASVSEKYLNLLQKIGFNGVIITDDLGMIDGPHVKEESKITDTIGWGINIVGSDYNKDIIRSKLNSICPKPEYIDKIIDLQNR